MLGNAADKFFLTQMQERVVATPSNGKSRSMSVPDRERAGTATVVAKGSEMPGPQRQVSSSWVPGMGTSPEPATPPSLQPSTALPGMGGITVDTSTLVMLGGLSFAAWYFLLRQKPKAA